MRSADRIGTRWRVFDVRCYEVDGPATEAAAIAEVEEQPDLAPVSRDLSAELVEEPSAPERVRP